MRDVGINADFWSGLVLVACVFVAGCGESSTPQSQFVTGEGDSTAVSESTPTGPLSTNEIDGGVVTTAGELPVLTPKAKKAAPSAKPLSEEAKEDLDAELEDDQDVAAEEDDAAAAPEPGTPEFKLREMALLKASPAHLIREPIAGKPGEFKEVKLTPEEAAKEQLRRWHKTVDLALEVIAETKDNQEQAQLFNNAVYYLTESRKQLAMRGEADQAQLLSDNAEALYKRDKTSFAAVESALRVVQLTQALAAQAGRQDTKKASTFAKQSRLFAEKFPQETNRAAMNLMAAGRLCEQVGLIEDATACYTAIEEKFPDSPFQETTAGVLRRLRLQGEKLTEFAGSTIDGGYISIDQFAGHPVLVVFWASNSQTFQNDLPQLQAITQKYEDRGLMVVGVNLDKDQATVDHFIEKHSISWHNIFFSDVASRGVNNPIARHYGVTTVPQYWLVNANGVVTAAPFDLKQADTILGGKTAVKPVSSTKSAKAE